MMSAVPFHNGRKPGRLIGPDGQPRERGPVLGLALAAVGVVFGDLGTSPLYTLQNVFSAHHGLVTPTREDVFGVVSLIVWCLLIIVSFAYVGLLTRADNQGEGGILSLAALIRRKLGQGRKASGLAVVLAIVGASLFFGDSLITPAISVLSAFEGLEVVSPELDTWIVPLAALVLTVLFATQRWGTAAIGKAFGPVMVVWFVTLAVLGAVHLVDDPTIIQAISPHHAVTFCVAHPGIAFVALGAVVLSVTGVEALYADLGHFGRGPISLAWFALIFPALLLSYLGQGAMILSHPETSARPFFYMAPEWGRLGLTILATLATVIASQAVITGTFSVSRQASRMSLLPRLAVRHTSTKNSGQIYLPMVNAMMFIGVLILVLAFRSSDRLASAYGLSVTGTLLLELSLFLLLAHRVWGWNWWKLAAVLATVGALEFALFAANIVKVASGGWLPLAIATVMITIMLTWKRGSRIMFGKRRDMEGPLGDFVADVKRSGVARVPGTMVFPHGNLETVPLALRRNVEVNRVLHEHTVIVTITHLGVPHVEADARVRVSSIGDPADGLSQIVVQTGFKDPQDIPLAVTIAARQHPELGLDETDVTYALSVFRIEPGDSKAMPRWQKSVFRALEKTSANRTQVFHLPPERTVVIGAEAEL